MSNMEISSAIPGPEQCVYTSHYCEENVWKLCELIKERCSTEELNNSYAIFISNEKKQIPLWHQKQRKAEDLPVIWDYHVVFAYNNKDSSLVFDLDSLLAFPCPFHEYVAAGIGDNKILKPEFWRMFRVIPASDFLSSFASDRTHMLDKDGSWLAPPPDYPPIKTQECSNNLQDCISMDPATGYGKVYTVDELISFFCPTA